VKAIVVGNGRLAARESLPRGTLDGAAVVVAADGGVRNALAVGLRPDLAVGDADSIGPAELRHLDELGIPFRRVAADKDESDLELAVRDAVARGADEVVIVGALDGERIEHTIANAWLLALPELRRVDAALVDDRSTIRLLSAAGAIRRLEIRGERGDLVSLFPFGGAADGVTTRGLRFPLDEERLELGPSRGLSNELTGNTASVSVRAGSVLVIHTRRTSNSRKGVVQ
jgi:thiamine pyrophosphokinase